MCTTWRLTKSGASNKEIFKNHAYIQENQKSHAYNKELHKIGASELKIHKIDANVAHERKIHKIDVYIQKIHECLSHKQIAKRLPVSVCRKMMELKSVRTIKEIAVVRMLK